MERHYDKEALDALKKKEYTYTNKNGETHEYTRYEAEQAQRKIERQIRRYKKRVAVYEAAGLQNLEVKAKLGEWQAVASLCLVILAFKLADIDVSQNVCKYFFCFSSSLAPGCLYECMENIALLIAYIVWKYGNRED